MNVISAGCDYKSALTIAGVDTLQRRREELTRRFFSRHLTALTTYCHQSRTKILPQNSEKNFFDNSKENTNKF